MSNQVALVTGVSSGIGQAVAEALAKAGYRVYGTVRSADAAVPAGITAIRMDVRDEASIVAGVEQIRKEAGRIDLVVNNAGGNMVGACEETETQQGQALFEVNFFGAVRVTHAVLPMMRAQRSGRIAFISSVLGFLPGPYMAFYAASKHAIEAYAESLDHEVRGFGVHALLIEPSFVRTKIDSNASTGAKPLSDYAGGRDRLTAWIQTSIAAGVDPAVVGAKVVEAAAAQHPKLRYPVGKRAGTLARLRSFVPAGIFDGALRRDLGLDG